MSQVQASLVFSLVVLGAMMGPISAFDHIVGGSFGWNIPSSKTFYEDWAKPRTFGVQDRLVFPFRAPLHNVIEVSKDEFENCTQEKPINMFAHGPLVFNFTQPGDYFYFSTIGTQCELGVKLQVHVVPGKGSSGRVFGSAPAPTATSAAGPVGVSCGLGMFVASLVAGGFLL